MDLSPIKVVITNAANYVSHSLAYLIGNGDAFGPNQPIILNLLDFEESLEKIQGIAMELLDCCFPLMVDVIATTDRKEAFKDVCVAIISGIPHDPEKDSVSLIEENALMLKEDAKALAEYADKNVKIIICCEPTNTSALILLDSAPCIPRQNFTAVTRLDQLRAQAQIADKLCVSPDKISNVITWGSQGYRIVPDARFAIFKDGRRQECVSELMKDPKWLENELVELVRNREREIICLRKRNSTYPMAKAVTDHINYLFNGTTPGVIVSMGVFSGLKGFYGAPRKIVYSYPVTSGNGVWNLVDKLSACEKMKPLLNETAAHLCEMRCVAFNYLRLMYKLRTEIETEEEI